MNNTDSALLRVIASTKRRNRSYSLLSIASDIKHLIEEYGSIKQVATAIGISPGMLSQFLKTDKLSPRMLELVRNREIDSISVMNSISSLSFNKQDSIVEYILNGKLNSLDIRYLIPLMKKNLDKDLDFLVTMLKNSENIKVSVIKFPPDFSVLNSNQIKKRFQNLIGKENFISIEVNENEGILKILYSGEKLLREKAREEKKTLSEFVEQILS